MRGLLMAALAACALFVAFVGWGIPALNLYLASATEANLRESPLGSASDPDGKTVSPIERGEYVFRLAGCKGCHTEAGSDRELAGGHRFDTPFGTFISPNITPDRQYGIGGWSLEDFTRALRHGVAPDGSDYYPVFPYTSFAYMSDQDIEDLFDYLMAQPPDARVNEPHELAIFVRFRWTNWFWKHLFFEARSFDEGALEPRFGWQGKDAAVAQLRARGAYIAMALGHCSECHSPRLGVVDDRRYLAGNPNGPDGEAVPNITPHPDGLEDWSSADIVDYLTSGMMPDGDYVGGSMADVIDNGLQYLTARDAEALAVFLRSLPAHPERE
jgi:mono/diheme cytochrome c family protein